MLLDEDEEPPTIPGGAIAFPVATQDAGVEQRPWCVELEPRSFFANGDGGHLGIRRHVVKFSSVGAPNGPISACRRDLPFPAGALGRDNVNLIAAGLV